MKTLNPYTKQFPDFDRTPKAVIAAICYSIAEVRLAAIAKAGGAA